MNISYKNQKVKLVMKTDTITTSHIKGTKPKVGSCLHQRLITSTLLIEFSEKIPNGYSHLRIQVLRIKIIQHFQVLLIKACSLKIAI